MRHPTVGRPSRRSITRGHRPVAHAEPLEPRTLLSVALAADVNAAPLSSAALGNLVALGGKLLFTQEDGRTGAELYTSDGTEAGTVLLKDILPGPVGSAPTGLTAINGKVYFAADDGTNGREVWATDGTTAGTRRVTDLNSGPNSSNPYGFAPTADGTGVLFFASPTGDPGNTYLYRTDGSTTVVLRSVFSVSGLQPSTPVAFGGVLYFTAGRAGASADLLRTDGTATGTRVVQTFPGAGFIGDLTVAGDRMFFATGRKNVYVTDGSDNGATLVATIGTGGTTTAAGNTGGIHDVRAVGGTVFFSVNDNVSGVELWAADATHAWRVKDIYAGSAGSSPTNLVAHGGRLYFFASDNAHGTEPWTSDGTDAGTYMVKDLRTDAPGAGSDPASLASAGGRLWFAATGAAADGVVRSGLWTSDGTADGTTMVEAIVGPAAFRPAGFTQVGADLFFTAADDAVGAEVWKTSAAAPAAASTGVVRDVCRPTGHAEPLFIGTLNGKLYYFADDGVAGSEPWYTDGTPGDSGLLKNINPGAAGSASVTPFDGHAGIATSQYLFFMATDGITSNGSYELWRTDGTAAGTIKLTTLTTRISHWAVVNDKVYFTLYPNSTLYVSDGTVGGTVPVTSTFGKYIAATLNGVLYTVRNDGTYGDELWRSDATPGGTYRVTDINPGAGSSDISGITAVGDALYFFASPTGLNNRLYTYVPATGAVTMVTDLFPGRDDGSGPAAPAGGRFFFSTTDGSPSTATYGQELYVSDGTADGTHLVKDINPGSGGSNPGEMIEVNGVLVFAVGGIGTGLAPSLWRSDGTEAGTYKLADVDAEFDADFVRMGDHVYLAATAGGFQALWRTDGTRAGTQLVSVVDPGGTGYTPQFAPAAGRLFFSGDDGLSGREAWVYTPDGLPPLAVQSGDFDPPAGLRFDLGRPLSPDLTRATVTVTNVTNGVALDPAQYRVSADPATGRLAVAFPGYPAGLPDGNYRATVPLGALTDTAGNPLAEGYTFDFFVLAGDANRDRTVNFTDLLAVARNYNKTGATWADGEFDGNGVVNFNDLLTLARNYNKSLPASGAAPAPAAAMDVGALAAAMGIAVPTTTPAKPTPPPVLTKKPPVSPKPAPKPAPVAHAVAPAPVARKSPPSSVLRDDDKVKPVFSTTRVTKPAPAKPKAIAKGRRG